MDFVSSARRPRPLGIALLTAWALVLGTSITALAVYAVYGIHTIPQALGAFQDVPEALVGIAALVTALQLAMAYGLWTLRAWGRFLAIAFALVGLVVGMFTLPVGIVGVLTSLGSVWYLTAHRTRALFRAAKSA